MDTSGTYIKMLFKLPQEFWGDYYKLPAKVFMFSEYQIACSCGEVGGLAVAHAITNRNHKQLPLPSQDQLQEMMGSDWKDAFERFAEYAGGNPFNYSREEMYPYELSFTKCTSMEQLWLAFVMREKCNKQWTGRVWSLFDKDAIAIVG